MDSAPLLVESTTSNHKYTKFGKFIRVFLQSTTCFEVFIFTLGIIFSICTGLSQPFMSYVFGEVTQVLIEITTALNNKTMDPADLEKEYIKFENGMDRVIIHFFICGCLYLGFGSLQSATIRYVGENATYRIRQKYIYRLLKKDAQYFDKTTTGHLSTVLNDNLERMREALNEKISISISLMTDFVVGMTIAFILDWKLSAYSVIFALGIAFSGVLNSSSMMNSTEKQNEHYATAGSAAFQVLGAFKTVVSLNGQKAEIEKYKAELKAGEKYGNIRAFFYGMSRGVTYFFCNALNAVTLYIGTNMIYNHELSPKIIVQLFHCLLFGGFALSEAFPHIALLASSISAAGPIAEVLIEDDNEIERENEGEENQETEFSGNITFNNVRFSYPTRPDAEVLKGVSFDVKKGECIALVGASGSGKSTIVQLLLHYYNVTGGDILIDNHKIEDINLKTLRKLVGVVSQEPVLFNTTIEENIKFGNPMATSAQIYAALKKANAYDFVTGFPQGIKTIVGERGAQLSGGQKQRLAIARTLLRNPKILLLDEATSALDNESEQVVQKALENASQGRTTLVVAHRLSTIRNASKIIVMQRGEIVEVGNHEELIAKKGAYNDLVEAQMLDVHDHLEEETLSRAHSHEFSSTQSHTLRRSVSNEQPQVTLRQLSHELSPVNSYIYHRSCSGEPVMEQMDHMERLIEELSEEGAVKSNIWEILKKCKSDFCILFVAMVTSALQGLHYPILAFLIVKVYGAYAMEGDDLLSYGHFWALMFMVLGIARTITIFCQYYYFGKAAERLSTRLRVSSYEHLLAMPCAFYDDPKHSATRLSTRLNADASNVKAAVDARLGNLVMTVVSCIAAVAVAFSINWKLTIQVLCLVPFLFISEYFYEKSMNAAVKEDSKAFENSNRVAVEALENVRTVRSLNMEDKVMEMVISPLLKSHNDNLRRSLTQGVAYGLAYSVFLFVYCVSFKYGVYLFFQHEILPMDMYRTLLSLSMTSKTAGSAISYFPDYKKAVYAAGLIFKLFSYPATMNVGCTDGRKNIDGGEIVAENIHFHYEQRPNDMILRGVNLKVEHGKTIALVGPSGCGKSTIIALLERFYHSVEGDLIIDKENVEDINLHHLRSNVALVSQEPTLFNGSIRENLIYGITQTVGQIEIEKALTIANAYNFVYQFPSGLETMVGERGTQLSGGQKQRIAIARAILRRPKILLLDEATSALDTDSEKVVQNALDTASERLSTVVVAHRLSTIVNADSIAVLKAGKVEEQGTHSELLLKRGIYWRLIQKQGGQQTVLEL